MAIKRTAITPRQIVNQFNSIAGDFGLEMINVEAPDFTTQFNDALKALNDNQIVNLTAQLLTKCWKQLGFPQTINDLYDFMDKPGDQMFGYIERFKAMNGEAKEYTASYDNVLKLNYAELKQQVSYDLDMPQFVVDINKYQYLGLLKTVEGLSTIINDILTERITNDPIYYLNDRKAELIRKSYPYTQDILINTTEDNVETQTFMNDAVSTLANFLALAKKPSKVSYITPFFTMNHGVNIEDYVLLISPKLAGSRALQLANTYNTEFINLFQNAITCYDLEENEYFRLVHKQSLNLFRVVDEGGSYILAQETGNTRYWRNVFTSIFIDAFFPMVSFVTANAKLDIITELTENAKNAKNASGEGITLNLPINVTKENKVLRRANVGDKITIKVNVPSGLTKANIKVSGDGAPTYDQASSTITVSSVVENTTKGITKLSIDYSA